MSVHSPFNTQTKGILLPKDAFVVIVRTDWNAEIIDELERGAKRILDEHKVGYKIISVPGAFEIPFAVKHIYQHHTEMKIHAFITLGCVIKGDTPHFDYVCKAVTNGVLQLNMSLPVPTIFGVLTVNDEAQAHARLGGAHGHKGEEAAITTLRMISMMDS